MVLDILSNFVDILSQLFFINELSSLVFEYSFLVIFFTVSFVFVISLFWGLIKVISGRFI